MNYKIPRFKRVCTIGYCSSYTIKHFQSHRSVYQDRKQEKKSKMKFSENIRIFKQQVKSHFVSDQVKMFVLFLDDFFPSEKIFNFFGYPYRLHNDEHQKLQNRKRNHFWLTIAVSLFLLFLITINLVISIMNPERFMEAIECFVLFGAYKFNLLRTFFLCYWKRATIKKIIDRLDQNFPHSSREQVQFGVHKHFKTLRKFYQICVTVYLFFWVKSFVAILFTICSEFLGFGSMEPKLLVPIYFPVDPYQPLLYPIFLILQLWTFLMVKFMLISTDMLFFGLTCVTSMEFDICARKIAQIDPENDENTEKKLGEIIDDYNELIEIANELERHFFNDHVDKCFSSISLSLCFFFHS
ncbi:hypothetical protein PVAND_000495 [Polypedilum vanderplanki]|uniref:Odorant receptor n=1 Tax=Polypedilum vanderplanki TaxID=319348 RepID=A0A9J6BJZ8_POLVA|nr:hypothetical protein PVAND_000495 [Polypedilum vanderplanki]